MTLQLTLATPYLGTQAQSVSHHARHRVQRGVIFGVLAALVPARQAASPEIVRALRYE